MVELTINGRSVAVPEGTTVLEAARLLGIHLPTLCYLEGLKPYGGCRLCLVEVTSQDRTQITTSCTFPVAEGLQVQTDTEEIREARRFVMDLLLSRCPEVPALQEMARQLELDQPSFPRGDGDCILCGRCVRMCFELQQVGAISIVGRGAKREVTSPFGEFSQVCRTCGACAFVCPTGHIADVARISGKIPRPKLDEFNTGLATRGSIYKLYPQAIPATPAIDRHNCVQLLTGDCGLCAEVCAAQAIDFSQQDETQTLKAGAMILAPGSRPVDPGHYLPYHYAAFSNVVTSLEFERLLSASGPFAGHMVRPSDHQEPRRIAWFQCVGSRSLQDFAHPYCSAVCCMYALKQALVAQEHSREPLDTAIFYMDMRTSGKDFDQYYQRAREQGVRFIHSRVHSVDQDAATGDLSVRYVRDDGSMAADTFDMVVLSVGLEISPETAAWAQRLGVKVDSHRFAQISPFTPVATSRPGLYVCGAFQSPKDIPSSVMEASAAAAAVGELLADSRYTAAHRKAEYPERDVSGEEPRLGVFVCHCGTNIAGVIDVEALTAYARTLPATVHAEKHLFTCSQDTQEIIQERIKELSLNRVVVASCSPRTHERVFQESLREAGLNEYLLTMANIRDQDAWVHQQDPEGALEKAKDLVRMAVARAANLEPLHKEKFPVTKAALVVGAGVAGMEAALSLANMGFPTHLVEKGEYLGGQAWNLAVRSGGHNYRRYLRRLLEKVESHPQITICCQAQVKDTRGFVGNFRTTLSTPGGELEVVHGATILATGGRAYLPTEYCYGQHPRIYLSLDLDQAIAFQNPEVIAAQQAVFILCVGSREPERPYCSQVCCFRALESALALKELNPGMDIFILFRDIRTSGAKEELYQRAREEGIMFIRFDPDNKPRVEITPENTLKVTVREPILGRPLSIQPDFITLANAIVPNSVQELAELFKVPLNAEGFFQEAHAKLRPVDFSTEGIYVAGLAHYPKPMDECIAQAKAAAARAATILAQDQVLMEPMVSQVDPELCIGCGLCVLNCTFGAIQLVQVAGQGFRAENLPAYCKGCGICAAGCPQRAIDMMHFRDRQMLAAIHAGGGRSAVEGRWA
ncbi:MAG: FAD-dependent oxidoreductase [Thermodesulfobacteriota bacterium]